MRVSWLKLLCRSSTSFIRRSFFCFLLCFLVRSVTLGVAGMARGKPHDSSGKFTFLVIGIKNLLLAFCLELFHFLRALEIISHIYITWIASLTVWMGHYCSLNFIFGRFHLTFQTYATLKAGAPQGSAFDLRLSLANANDPRHPPCVHVNSKHLWNSISLWLFFH